MPKGDTTMNSSNASEAAGALVGQFIFVPLIILGLTWVVVKIAKKRNLTKKEVMIALAVGLGLAVISALGNAGA